MGGRQGRRGAETALLHHHRQSLGPRGGGWPRPLRTDSHAPPHWATQQPVQGCKGTAQGVCEGWIYSPQDPYTRGLCCPMHPCFRYALSGTWGRGSAWSGTGGRAGLGGKHWGGPLGESLVCGQGPPACSQGHGLGMSPRAGKEGRGTRVDAGARECWHGVRVQGVAQEPEKDGLSSLAPWGRLALGGRGRGLQAWLWMFLVRVGAGLAVGAPKLFTHCSCGKGVNSPQAPALELFHL